MTSINNADINKCTIKNIIYFNKNKWNYCHGSGGIRTHASEETGALNQRLRPLGHATLWMQCRNCCIDINCRIWHLFLVFRMVIGQMKINYHRWRWINKWVKWERFNNLYQKSGQLRVGLAHEGFYGKK